MMLISFESIAAAILGDSNLRRERVVLLDEVIRTEVQEAAKGSRRMRSYGMIEMYLNVA